MIGITGHTKGLGQHLFNQFQKNNHVKGFSRSNGFDIKNPNHRQKIYEQIEDCDILLIWYIIIITKQMCCSNYFKNGKIKKN